MAKNLKSGIWYVFFGLVTLYLVIGVLIAREQDKNLADLRGRLSVLMDLVLYPPSNPELQGIKEALQDIRKHVGKGGNEQIIPAKPISPPLAIPETTRGLTTPELRKKVIALANNMRDFENNFQMEALQRDLNQKPLIGTEEEKNKQWNQQIKDSLQRRQAYANEFRKRFLGEALSYRDEMLRRLNIMPPEEEKHVLALQGLLAGPHPISELSAYLERMARQLPE